MTHQLTRIPAPLPPPPPINPPPAKFEYTCVLCSYAFIYFVSWALVSQPRFNPARLLLLLTAVVILQKPQPAKKEKKKKKEDKKEEEDDGSRDLGIPAPEKKAPHPLAVMDKEAKSPLSGDTWKKARHERCCGPCSGLIDVYTSARLARRHMAFAPEMILSHGSFGSSGHRRSSPYSFVSCD